MVTGDVKMLRSINLVKYELITKKKEVKNGIFIEEAK